LNSSASEWTTIGDPSLNKRNSMPYTERRPTIIIEETSPDNLLKRNDLILNSQSRDSLPHL